MERACDRIRDLEVVEVGKQEVRVAAVLYVLGLVEGLGRLAGSATDAIGRSIEERTLPTRVRLPRSSAGKTLETQGTVKAR